MSTLKEGLCWRQRCALIQAITVSSVWKTVCVYECSLRTTSVLCLAPRWAFQISTDSTFFPQKPQANMTDVPLLLVAEETGTFVSRKKLTGIFKKQVTQNLTWLEKNSFWFKRGSIKLFKQQVKLFNHFFPKLEGGTLSQTGRRKCKN